jgi:signal peptidase II
MPTLRKAFLFWPFVLVLLLTDCATKELAVDRLTPHVPHEVLGSVVQFTLAYNPDMAFGLGFGQWSRPILIGLAFAIIVFLHWLYRAAPAGDRWMALALGLITGGAVGNLVDRIRWDRGVVDFIDLGVGSTRFWIFNIADIAICTGAVLLGWLLLKRDALVHRDAPAEPT